MEPQQQPYEKAITNTWGITMCINTKKFLIAIIYINATP